MPVHLLEPAGGRADTTGPVQLLRSQSLHAGVPYAYAALAGPGAALLFTAGACPLDAAGRVVAPGDVTAQARQVMANLRTTLAEAGAHLGCVVKSTVYVVTTEHGDLDAAWAVVSAALGEHDAPSTLLGVTVLGWPDQLVEVEAVAVLPTPPRGQPTGPAP